MNFKKKVGTILLIIFSMLAITACGTEGDVQLGKENKVSGETISNSTMSITVPETWADKFIAVVDEDSIALYQKRTYVENIGGWLCSIESFKNSEDYKELPQYDVIATGGTDQSEDTITYIVNYPSDVQADVENQESMDEYFKMYDEIKGMLDSFKLVE